MQTEIQRGPERHAPGLSGLHRHGHREGGRRWTSSLRRSYRQRRRQVRTCYRFTDHFDNPW